MAFGKSNAQTKRFTEGGDYDASRYQYGGYAGGARDERANLAIRQNDVEARKGPMIDRTQSDQSRGFQMGSLANLDAATKGQTEDMRLLSGAANGTAPSRAEQLGQQMSDRALRSQVSAAGNVRGGPGAQAAAFRQASQGAAQQRADMNQGIQAERAAEMATARGQFAGAMGNARGQLASAATSTRGQDIGLATDQARLDQNQTALNDARAQQYETLQNKVATDQLNANVQQQQIASGYNQNANQLNTQTNQKNADKDWDLIKGIGGAASGALGGVLGLLSDPNSKAPIMGSLASLGMGGVPAGSEGPGAATFEKLSPGGGLDVGGSMKAHSDFATQYSRNATSGPTTLSDMNAKGSIMLSPGEAKNPVTLDEALRQNDAARYDTAEADVRTGFNGTPRGYASGRGAAEDDDGPSWLEPGKFKTGGKVADGPDYSKLAPGSEDFERYGASKAKEGDPDWKRGGETKKAGAKKAPGWAQILSGGLGGFGAWTGGSRDVMRSDEASKREAFQAGVATARAYPGERISPEGWPESKLGPKKGGNVADRDWRNMQMAAIERGDERPKEEKLDPEAGLPPQSPHPLPPPPPPPMERPRIMEIGATEMETPSRKSAASKFTPAGRKRTTSDEQAKAPVMDTKGGRDPQTFKRDTKADQARVKRAHEDKAGREADELMAAYGKSLGKGASVAMDEGEIDDKFGTMPDQAMAQAMRSMEASPYAYKEGLRPPEQKPGEVNIGPMANKMAADPVARTAIVRDPGTGLLAIDKDKATKVIMGSLASLQDQLDDMKNDVPRAARAKKQRRRGDSAQP